MSRGAVVAILLVVALLGWVSAKAITYTPSFDGAMNLQVSWSLAQGEGYRRTYADRKPFPREVQSNTPLTVPAAAVYNTFGMGRAQSQAVNLLYLYALVGLGYLLVARRFGVWAGVCAALILIATPSVVFEGLKGYGEVPGLVWALAALSLLPVRDSTRWRAAPVLLAGTCLGLALATKTVLAICVAAFGICIVLGLLGDTRERWPRRLGLCALVGVGAILPLFAVETWRFVALGGMSGYEAWWLEQWDAINAQTGTRSAPGGLSDYLAKGAVHLAALARFNALSPLAALAWLSVPFLLAFVAAIARWPSRRHLPLAAILLAVAMYFGWWLLLSPDNKVWHRRILDGCLMLNLAWVYVTAWLLENRGGWRPVRIVGIASAIATAALFAVFVHGKFLPTMTGPGSSVDYARAIEIVRSLPPDAAVYGLGWNSAPHISLLAERPFGDFNDLVPSELDRSRPAYIVLDAPGIGAKSHLTAISTYPSESLMPGAKRAQVYKLDLSRFAEPGPHDATLAQSFVSLTDGRYEPSGGIGEAGPGGRWVAPDSFVRLRYDGSEDVFLSATAAAPERYRERSPVVLTLDIDGCTLGAHPVPRDRDTPLRIAIPERCRPAEGSITTLGMAASDVLDDYIGHGGRARALTVRSVGFAPGCVDDGPCAPPKATPRVRGPKQVSNAGMLHGHTPVPVCGTNEPLPFVVSWDATSTMAPRVDLLIRDANGTSKLWTGGQSPAGNKRTGPWMRVGMAILLSLPGGEIIDELNYTVPACTADGAAPAGS